MSDTRAQQKHSKGLHDISRHRRAAPILPTKTKLLSFTPLDYIVSLFKRHLDRFRSSRFEGVVSGQIAIRWLVILNL